MNRQFLLGFVFYVITVCVGVFFAVVYDYDPYDQTIHTVLGGLFGSSSTVFALVIVAKICKKEKKEIVK